MKHKGIRSLLYSATLISLFAGWTFLIKTVDVQPIGPLSTNVGLATLNNWFHNLTNFNMTVYSITDWLGLVPVSVCIFFAIVGLFQAIKRKSLFKVDSDIILLGAYYIVVIFVYLIFETITINYRPILINGFLEKSYPSSTTLLVLSVMPTLAFQAKIKIISNTIFNILHISTIIFCLFMVIGRLVSGVHWITDIIGGILLSIGLFYFYKGTVLLYFEKRSG
ncbi:MAG: phosphatase PAP2 family protein [Ruminococcaceae bacterium]|nr:phosphatase PAP2 family protein [Oscillospiraceae bacterium]